MALVIPGSVIDLERIESGDGIATADGMRALLDAVNTLLSRPRAIEQLGQQTVGVVSTAIKLGDIDGGDTGTTTDAGIGIELGEKTVGSGLTDKWALINGRDAFGPFAGLYNVTNGKCVWKAYAEGSTLALSPPIDGNSASDTNAIGGSGTQRWDEGWFADLNVSGTATLADITLGGNPNAGAWTSVAHAAGNFTADGGGSWTVASGDQITFAYAVINKTMHLNVGVQTTTVASGPSSRLEVAIPGSFVAAHDVRGPMLYVDAGTLQTVPGMWRTTAGGSQILLYKDVNISTNWTNATDNTTVWFSATFAVQ